MRKFVKNNIFRMKYLHVLFFVLLINIPAISQEYPIEVTLQIPPPYSPYIVDYLNGTPNSVAIIRNISNSEQKIKFVGTITGDNGIKIQTNENYSPLQPLVLNPMETKVLNSATFKNYYKADNFDVSGFDKNEIIRLGTLPEGNYDICFKALDYSSGQQLSQSEPMGCINIPVEYADVPQLVMPRDLDTLYSIQMAQPPTVFTWIAPTSLSMGNFEYNLQLLEMPDATADPNTVMGAATQFLIDRKTNATSYITTPSDPKFIPGKMYAWRVVVSDKFNKIKFRNNGISIAWKFFYLDQVVSSGSTSDTLTPALGSSDTDPKACNIKILVPDIGNVNENTEVQEKIKMLEKTKLQENKLVHLTNNEKVKKNFNFNDNIPIIAVNNLNDFYVMWENTAKPAEHESYKINIFDLQDNLIFSYLKTDLNDTNYLFGKIPNVHFLQRSKNEMYMLKDQELYNLQIVQIESASDSIINLSEKRQFRYVIMADSVSSNKKIYNISGKIVYKFQDSPEEYPANLENIQLEKFIMIKNATTGAIIADGISPLKYGITEKNTITIPVDEDGAFNAPFSAADGSGDISELIKGTQNQSSQNKSPVNQTPKDQLTTNLHIYGDNKYYEYYVLKLNNPHYVEPNIRVELNSDSMQLGTISTYVWSYTLKLKITQGYKYGNLKLTDFKDYDFTCVMIRPNYTQQHRKQIPFYEGDITKPDQYGDFGTYKYVYDQGEQSGRKATVTQEKDENGKIQTYLTFKNLLINLNDAERYEIKIYSKYKKPTAIGKGQNGEGTRTLSFKPSIHHKFLSANNKKYNFHLKTTCNLIVDGYPTASLSGKLVYRDPGNPKATIKPIANTWIGLIVTYYVQDANNNKTILDPYHVLQEAKDNKNKACQTWAGSLTNPIEYAASVDDSLEHPFKDGNTLIAWTYTNNDGSFLFKDFKHLDSLKTWDEKRYFVSSGSHESQAGVYIDGKVVRTVRLVFPNFQKKYFYAPSNDIQIQPFDSMDVGTLTAYLRTYNLTVKPVKSCTDNEEKDKGGAIRKAKVKIERKYDIPDYEVKFQSDKIELGEKYVEGGDGVTFYGLFMHNKGSFNDGYKITTKTNDTIGEYSYKPSVIEFPRGYEEWKKSCDYINKPYDKYSEDNRNKKSLDSLYGRKISDYLFVEDYVPINYSINVYLEPKQPIISGRILDASNPMRSVESGVVGIRRYKQNGGLTLEYKNIGENKYNGYFVFQNLETSPKEKYKLTVEAKGYYLYGTKEIDKNGDTSAMKSINIGSYIPQGQNDYITLSKGQQVHYAQILMMPKGRITGKIIDEDGKPVKCYVRTSRSSMQETIFSLMDFVAQGASQRFSLRVPTGVYDTLFIFPKDLKYFNDTVLIKPLKDVVDATLDMGTIVVKERRHRIVVNVYRKSNPGENSALTHVSDVVPLSNIEVKILDYRQTTSGHGKAEFNFKNASQKNFWVKITPPKGSIYMPMEATIENEESKTNTTYIFTLKKGFTAKGKVEINSTNGSKIPAKNATVFASFGDIQVKTQTDSTGYYSLYGIPTSMVIDFHQKKRYQHVKIKCIPSENDKSSGIMGCDSAIYFDMNSEETPKTVDFTLASFDKANISRLNGFNVNIYSIKPKDGYSDRFDISGTIDLNSGLDNFTLLDTAKLIKFTDMYVSLSKEKDRNGKPYLTVPDNGGTLDIVSLRTVLKGNKSLIFSHATYDYNILINPAADNKLRIIRIDDKSGKISAKARIVDNSFNFPGSYFRFNDEQFYLSEKTGNNSFSQYLDVFSTNTSKKSNSGTDNTNSGIKNINKNMNVEVNNTNSVINKTRDNYYFSDEQGKTLKFKFLNFNATSEEKESYIDNIGNITIKPVAKSNIRLDPTNPKSVKIIKVDLPSIVINSEGISCSGKIKEISIDLEKWKIIARDCDVSPELGGIYSTKAKISTGSLDIDIAEFNLRSDFMFLGKPNLSYLPLGDVSRINITKGSQIFFGLDPRCGNDLGTHYKLTVCNERCAGYIQNLPGISKLEFQAISILSNGEPPIISFPPGSDNITLYGIVNFRPYTIEAYKDAFTVNGALDFGLPRIPNGINYKLEYTKPSNSIKFRLIPSDVKFDAPGYTKFESIATQDKQEMSMGQVKLYGRIYEPGKLDPISVVLTKKIEKKEMEYSLSKNPNVGEQFILMNGDQNKFRIEASNMMRTGSTIQNSIMANPDNDWDLLRLTLKPVGKLADDSFGNKELYFAVHGDIKTDETVSNQTIEPPQPEGSKISFGDFVMVFNLQEPSFYGSMNIPEKSFGAVKFGGTAEIKIDPHGFYFVGAGLGDVPPLGAFGIGMIIGDYKKGGFLGGVPESAISKVTQYSIGKGLPCAFEKSTTFQGVFITGKKSIPGLYYNESVNVFVGTASVHTDAGMDASAWFKFGGSGGIAGGVAMTMFAIAELKLEAITCTTLEAGAKAIAKATAEFQNKNFSLGLCASLEVYGSIQQKVPPMIGAPCDSGVVLFEFGGTFIKLRADIGFSSSSGLSVSFGKGSCETNKCD
ncbi:MAG: hypothetical protein GX372_00750 [Ignavibacteria bacterium]|jgi:hypothetical protein|nr:hypothetical protein [Ignavibacteria bacterium]